jgi:ATP-dependent Lon protease
MDTAQPTDQLQDLKNQLNSSQLPNDLKEHVTDQLARLEMMMKTQGLRIEFDKEIDYMKFLLQLPFNKKSADILDLRRASEILNKNHYGLQNAKDRILEYLSVLILNNRRGTPLKAPILAFVGLVGSGKTSIAYSIAETLGRKVVRIPFGGLGSAVALRGGSRVNPEAEPGQIAKALKSVGVSNPVILLDEIDRVTQDARADVMGVLVELLDPEQNFAFTDHYVDYPLDLSNVLFVATANNTANIATAVLDRMEMIEMPAYSDEEKIVIGKSYLLPRALQEAGLDKDAIMVDDTLWPQIVRPLGFDGGIRSLQRNIQGLVRKVARGVVEGQSQKVQLTSDTIKNYLQ